MSLPKITAEEFKDYYLANTKIIKMLNTFYIFSIGICVIALMIIILFGFSESDPMFNNPDLKIYGFRPFEIILIYLGLSAFVILKLEDILHFIWSDQKIKDKMSGDITYRPGKHASEITLTDPLEKYTYICDMILKSRLLILIFTSCVGIQIFIMTYGSKSPLGYFVLLPPLFTFYNLRLIKQQDTGGFFVFSQRILPLIDKEK